MTGFNSMIVRLKEGVVFSSITAARTFQFYDSPIKRWGFAKAFPLFFGFNSMIVRLKEVYKFNIPPKFF